MASDGDAVHVNAHNIHFCAIAGNAAPGTPGSGSMGLYQAVQLASKQKGWSSSANSRTGPQYWMFGAPGSAACAAAARAQGTTPVAGQHCLLSGPENNVNDLRVGFTRFLLDYTAEGAVVGGTLGNQLGVPNANSNPQQSVIPIFSPANSPMAGFANSALTI